MNLDRQQLEAFACILDAGGFERAAQQLHLSQSAISQRLRTLEQTLGCALLIRTSPPQPTAAGHTLLRHIRQLRLMEAAVADQLRPAPGRNISLSVAVNADSLATWFLPGVQPACVRQGLLLEVMLDDENHTHSWLQRGEVSGCITALATPLAGGVAEPLGMMEYACVATRSFAAQWLPHGLQGLRWQQAPAISFNRKDTLHAQFIEQHFGVAAAQFPRHLLPSPEAFLSAIRLGLGYGFVPVLQLPNLAHEAELIELAPAQRQRVMLYWQHWRLEPEAAQRLSQAVMTAGRQALVQLPHTTH